ISVDGAVALLAEAANGGHQRVVGQVEAEFPLDRVTELGRLDLLPEGLEGRPMGERVDGVAAGVVKQGEVAIDGLERTRGYDSRDDEMLIGIGAKSRAFERFEVDGRHPASSERLAARLPAGARPSSRVPPCGVRWRAPAALRRFDLPGAKGE